MKRIQKESDKKKWLMSALVVLAVIAGGIAAVVALQGRQKAEQATTTPSAEQSVQQTTTENSPEIPSPKTPTESETPAPANQLTASITAANQNGNILQIRTLIETIAASGTCGLILTKDSVQISRSADVTPLANSSTCKGFDIPTTELSPGKWNLTIDITIGNQKTALKQEVDIK